MNDDIYLKMVLALPSLFFKDWKFNDGDKFWLTDDTDEWYVPSNEYEAYTIIDGKLVSHVVDPEDWIFASLDVGRPMPTQEQLQKICMKLIQCSPKDLLRFFEAWLYEDEIRPVVDFEDFDDLWLKYTMWVWGRMEWNGSEWV